MHSSLKTVAVLVLLLGLGSVLLARQANDPTKAIIEGMVVNDVTGDPIAGAEVQLGVFITRSSTPPQPGIVENTPRVPNVPILTTGPDGKFSFTNLSPSEYRVIASANSYIRQEYGQKAAYGIGRPVYLAPGQTLKDVNIRLLPTGAVSGRVLQQSGQPALGATVWILRASFNSQGRRLDVINRSTADDRGDFRAFGITPGRYYLAAGTDTETVRRPYGAFVGDPNVGRVENYAIAYYPAATDVERATMIEIQPGMEVRADMRVSERKEYHIRGRVIDAATNKPPERLQIDLRSWDVERGLMNVIVPDNYDAKSGNFDLLGASPGNYTLRLRVPVDIPANLRNDPTALGALLSTRQRMPEFPVTVSDKDVEGLSLVLSGGVTMPARLVVEGQPPTDLSKFNARVGVVLYYQRFSGVDPSPSGTPPITPEGAISFSNLVEGDYSFQVFSLPTGFYLKSVKYGGVDVRNKPIAVGSSPDTLEITVQRGTGTLTGAVFDSRDNLVAGIPVALVPDQRDLTENYRIGITGRDGSFSIGNIPPGRYKVFSWEASDQGAYFDRDFVSRYEQQGRAVTIQDGATSRAENVRLILKS
jgi:hypothetical protein